MPRNLRSVVNKPSGNKPKPKSTEKRTPKRKSEPTSTSSSKRPRSSSVATSKQTSRVRRNLQEALELDRSFNSDQEIGEAEKLMYAILPGNSQFINNLKTNSKNSKADTNRSRVKTQQKSTVTLNDEQNNINNRLQLNSNENSTMQ